MSAIRLARGFTGRDVVVKFAGCYHGHVDALLASAGSGLATFAVPGHPRRTRSSTALDAGAALQRPGRGRGGVRRARRPDRLPHHRGRARQHGRGPAGAGVQRLPRRDLPPARRPVRQRRGDDRLPRLPAGSVGPRRRRGGLAPGPDDLRQGDGRRLPRGRVRRPRRRHVAARARGPRLPGRHAVGEPGRDHRRPHHAAAGHRRRLRPPAPGRRRDQDRRRRRAVRRRRRARRADRRDHVLGVLHRRPGPRLRRRLAHRLGGVRRLLPRHARRGGLPAAVGVRGVVPVRRPRRPGGPDRPRRPARCGPRAPPRPRARRRSPTDPDPRHRRHLLRHGEVHNPEGVLYGRRDGYHLSELGVQMAERVADVIGDRDIVHCAPRRSSARRRRRGRWPLPAGSRSSPTSGSSSRPTSSRASGSAAATARCASRRPGGTCGTRSGRRGASPTRRSWPG